MNTEKPVRLSSYSSQPSTQEVIAYPLNPGAAKSSPTFHATPVKRSGTNRFWQGICRRAVLVVGLTTAFTAGAYSWTSHQTPEYQGSFQLFMEPSEDVNSPLQAGTDESAINYASEVKLLESPKVMKGILEKIQTRYPEVQYSSLFNRTTGLTHLESDRLAVGLLPDTQILQVSYQDSDPEKIEFVLDQIAQGYVDYSIRNSQVVSLTQQKIQRLDGVINPLKSRVDQIRREMLSLQQANVFVTPESKNQQLAERLGQIRAERLNTQSQLQQYQAQYQMLQQQLGLSPEQALLSSALTQSPRYQALLEKLLDVETTIALESARFTDKAPQIQSLLDQRAKLLPLLQEEAQKILGRDVDVVDPRVLQFQDSIRAKLTENLIASMNNVQMLQVRQQVLERAENELNQEVQAFPAVAQKYKMLEKELETSSQRLNDLENRRQELALEIEPKPDEPWEVIADPTIPQNQEGEFVAVAPIWPLNLALGGLVGLALGIGAAHLAERSNNVFHTTDELIEDVPLPLLGVIPASDEALMLPAASVPQLQMAQGQAVSAPSSPFQEAFRSLNANLRLSTDNPVRACVISSATPSDGKSTVALNLAKGAAAMGQKVLLIDADLRCPKVHKTLGLSNEQGLSDLVAEQTLELDQVIESGVTHPNLSVLTAGQSTVDPTYVLASPVLPELMQKFYEMFDLIIYDTAPLLGLADANLIAPHTDGLMVVVGVEKTDRQAVKLALREIQTAGIPVLGMISNGDKQESQYYAYY
ncbi:MAG: GumC family protein [Microcoleaceae cyanobacterium]